MNVKDSRSKSEKCPSSYFSWTCVLAKVVYYELQYPRFFTSALRFPCEACELLNAVGVGTPSSVHISDKVLCEGWFWDG